jgi:ABC-type multidrug transport system fused ATPase/permease subunit
VLCASELLAPRLRGRAFDAVLAPGASLSVLRPHLRGLALLALVGWLANIVAAVLFASARWSASMAGRVKLMGAVLAQEPGFFDAQPPGELASRLLSEPERLQELANRGPERLLLSVLSLGGGAALMCTAEWRLALLAVLLRAPLLARLAVRAGRTVGLYGALQQHTLNRANAYAAEALAQPLTVAVHAARAQMLREYGARVLGYLEVIRATLLSETALRFTALLIDSVTQQLLLVCGLVCVLRGSLTLGGLTAFFAYADTFAAGCRQAQELLEQAFALRPACARYFALLDRVPSMRWDGGAVPPEGSFHGALRLEGVSFGFPGRGAALCNLSLAIPAGATVAVVGPSGSGKSTLLKLLARLYDPDEGVVRWDGDDARTLSLDWLRGKCGYVPQEPPSVLLLTTYHPLLLSTYYLVLTTGRSRCSST